MPAVEFDEFEADDIEDEPSDDDQVVDDDQVDLDDEIDQEDDDDDSIDGPIPHRPLDIFLQKPTSTAEDKQITQGSNDANTVAEASNKPKPTKKVIDNKSVKLLKKANDLTGVVYFSRIPPFMTPAKLKSLIIPHGALGRIFLVKESASIAAKRKKYRHNKRTNYVEGWVEFQSKKEAKRAVELLNGQRVDNRKRSRYHDDLWSCKYLKKFKWADLTEQMSYEKAVREQKIRVEMSHAKRENKHYMRNVATAKMVEAIQERKTKKRKMEEDADTTGATTVTNTADTNAPVSNDAAITSIRRRFKQRKIIDSEALDDGTKTTPGVKMTYTPEMEAKKKVVLSKLFAASS
ncbi:hypothetical protein SmJEL517_g04928 [Synchytrium microbalum]|uniref:18S rRNA factor 2 n=1 Tax=Synchytrium microbalum TaxID=1806994 RepID=A0A507C2W0_9FUNG|nr:uncharacterized protein SmJEL517_g04928 [Synchytrium microbalum]TPX31875.1 hypothetical protein SmJEL517_g04928 [Synchytrium microbalum]